MGLTIGGILGALLAGWIGGRAHLRANQLRGMNRALGQPAGTLEARANEATLSAADQLGRVAESAIDQRMGGVRGDGQ